ncbi:MULTISPECIES: Ig-like domain-containing protein [Aeromonas]|uniref:Ig-like domain-containing protein n=1 Tax=Aeromonas TaxID=642 RepID=UPI00051C0C1F|nr:MULTISPECIES: Ig-like domain-containing protein [Aeromonas]MCH7373103.1 Ig-like domain-containing protein [Aeromonas sp. MR16]
MSVLNMRYVLLSTMALLLGSCDTETMVPVPSGSGGGNGPGARQITNLQVTPSESRIPAGLQQQFIAKVTLDDGSITDATHDVILQWSSSDASIVTVDATGRATAVGAGIASVNATGTENGKVFEASARLEVTDAVVTDLALTPTTASSMPPSASQPIVITVFVANATLSDGSILDLTNNPALNWSSSDVAVATVSNSASSKGAATAAGAGTTTITATGILNGQNFSATADLTVTP